MKSIENALNYFIDYEINERLNNLELKGKDYINIGTQDLKADYIMKRILDKKRKKVISIIKRIKFKDETIQEKVNEKIKNLEHRDKVCEEDLQFNNFVNKQDYKYPDNYAKDELIVERILEDNKLLILYPIVMDMGRKVPLICFEINIVDNRLSVSNYHIQCDAMRIIISIVYECELSEVEIYVKDFSGFVNSINNIKENDFLKIVEIMENEIASKLKIKDFKFLEFNKNFNTKAVTSEIVLTLEVFDDILFPPYQAEIEEVKYHLHRFNSKLLEKYLFGNKISKFYENQDIEPHYGSYVKDYSINEKQAVVISSYQKSDLLAVSGPPGTGKTTVLKEVISDNIVRKTMELINVWDNDWDKIRKIESIEVRQSPLKGRCNYSMVIASSNNNAVNNIGVELLNEISYFSKAIQGNKLNYRGVLCAKLGRKANMKEFHEDILNPMIDYLNTIDDYDDKEANKLKKDFLNIQFKLKDMYNSIDIYLKKRKKVQDIFSKLGIFSNLFEEHEGEDKEDIEKFYTEISLNKKEIFEYKDKLKDLESKKTILASKIIEIEDKVKLKKEDKIFKEKILNKMNKKKLIPFIGNILLYSMVRKYGNEEDIYSNIKSLTKAINVLEKEYDLKNDEYTILESNCRKLKEAVDSKEKLFNSVEKLNEVIEEFSSLKNEYLLEEVSWNSSAHKFLNNNIIVINRNKLFELSLGINELYVKKYRKDIVYNLNQIFTNDKWFYRFYQRGYRYNEKYQSYLKAMWETIFLCFPVVTTTLYSLDKIKFPMIPEIFDTILIDEAGQAVLHTAIGPLLRFRRALIVGDNFQLEPIHKNRNQPMNNSKIDDKYKDIIDVQKNSIQHCADRGSDFYDKLGDDKVGIVLTEHRRCERSIVKFSNDYVYKKTLIIKENDKQKDFLGSNICMIDVRGIQKGNVNESELEVCGKIIDALVNIYGKNVKKI